MPQINQLSKTDTLQRGDQVPTVSTSTNVWYPNKFSIWLLIQYLATGVFPYLNIRDYYRVPGVPFADLPDPVEAGMGARAFCTDAGREPDALLTVGKNGLDYGFSRGVPFGDYGSISNNIYAPNGGTIKILYWDEQAPSDNLFFFALEGEYPNSGWNTIVVNGVTFARTDATYAWDNVFFPGLSIWQWTAVANPFSAEGEVDEIYFGATGFGFNDPVGGGGSINVPVFSDGSIWRAG